MSDKRTCGQCKHFIAEGRIYGVCMATLPIWAADQTTNLDLSWRRRDHRCGADNCNAYDPAQWPAKPRKKLEGKVGGETP